MNAKIPQRQFRNSNQRPYFPSSARRAMQLCRNCGLTSSENPQKCGENVALLGLVNILLKAKHGTTEVYKINFLVCAASQKLSYKPSRPNLNSIDETKLILSMIFKAITKTQIADQIMIVPMKTWWPALQVILYELNQKKAFLQIGNIKVGLLIDSESVCSISNESLAAEVINNSNLAQLLTTVAPKELRTFANEPIPVIGMMQTPGESNSCRIEHAEFVEVRDGLKPLICRDVFEAIGISITQTLNSKEGSMINNITSQCPFKTRVAIQFPQLITRICSSKVNIEKSKFHKHFNQNINRVEEYLLIYKIELTLKLKKNTKNDLLKNSIIVRTIISQIVITAKRDQTLMLAIDSKILDNSIHKNKYQMPNMETLIDSISQNITDYNTEQSDKIFFFTIDLKYAYSQLNLHLDTAKN